MTAPFLALHELFAEGRPDTYPVCHTGQRLVGWGEFALRVSDLAALLKQRHETRWLLTSDDPLEFVSGLFASLLVGKQVVIPPNTRAGTLSSLGDAFDARMDALDSESPPTRFPLAVIDPHTAIIDLYTSGSTGEHKCVRKSLAQFEAEVAVLEALWGEQTRSAAILATAPHQHIYGLLFRIFWPLSSGRVFDAVTCAHPDILEERLAALGAGVLISTPAQLTRLPELLSLASLAPKPVAIFSSGGLLSAGAAEALTKGLGYAPIEVFGSTETGGVAWRQQAESAGDMWTPFPCHTLSCSGRGALTLVSPFLAQEQPWEMDDGIDLLPDGRFRLRGRLDRIVKIEEKRLSLPDMEFRLSNHDWVDSAAVVALSGHRQSVGAVVVLNAPGKAQLLSFGKRAMAQALRKHLADHFEAVLLPRRWRFPDILPTNERGKVAHAALTALFECADLSADDSSREPPLLPEISTVIYADSRRTQVVLDLHVTPDIAHFAGHFPGAPILPGVVQIDWAMRFARQYLALEGEFSALENLKFLGVVLPDAKLQLALVWDSSRKHLDFSYATPERKYSTGRIVLECAQ